MTSEELHEEERTSPRRRVLKGAFMNFHGTHAAMSCTVRDLSETGARIQVAADAQIPSDFDLVIELDGTVADCNVVWRSGTQVGLKFKSEPTQTKPIRSQIITARTSNKPTLRKQVH